jgi:Ca2+-dependent lipid-binding protein
MQIIYKTLALQWNQIIELQETGEPLILHVKDHNAVLPTASIGHCTVEYSMLSPNQPTEKWIPLQGVKSGEIHVKITRKAPSMEKKNTLEADASAHAKGHKISTQVWGSECVLAVSLHSNVSRSSLSFILLLCDEHAVSFFTDEK